MNAASRPDPRNVGDLVFSGYWHTYAVILRVEVKGNVTWITQLNLMEPNESVESGTPNVKTHCTAWDWRRDKYCSSNFIEDLEPDSFKDYDEFLYIMRDCVDYAEHVSY